MRRDMDLLRTLFTIIFFLVPLFILSLSQKVSGNDRPPVIGSRLERSGLNWILFRLPFHPDLCIREIFSFVPKLPYASQ
jgi:hypothetical protein